MRNCGECLPNNCLNWLALGACIYGNKKIDTMLRLVGLEAVKSKEVVITKQEIIDLYTSGYSVNRIWRMIGRGPEYIKPILIEAGVYRINPNNKHRTAYKDVDVNEIIKLRQDGWSLRKIAKQMSISRATVQRRLKNVGLE